MRDTVKSRVSDWERHWCWPLASTCICIHIHIHMCTYTQFSQSLSWARHIGWGSGCWDENDKPSPWVGRKDHHDDCSSKEAQVYHNNSSAIYCSLPPHCRETSNHSVSLGLTIWNALRPGKYYKTLIIPAPFPPSKSLTVMLCYLDAISAALKGAGGGSKCHTIAVQ